MIIPILVLLIVFALIAVRQIGNIKLHIWQIMLFGAITVLLTAQITPIDALKAINIDVMLFLFGMFIVGVALEESGYLAHLSYKFFRNAKSADILVLLILFGMGIASAFLMNDTLAIVGTPVVLLLAKQHKMHSKVLLLALAFAVTIGSVMSPIGNPQNLLIAINGNIENPFITFSQFLIIPTLINLFIAYLILKIFHREHFHKRKLRHYKEPIKDKNLATISKFSLILIVVLVFAKIITVFINLQVDFKLTYIALLAALPILALSSKRIEIFKKIDWHTLIFFASMFILMQSVWQTGFFQSIIANMSLDITSIFMIFLISIILSQFISNVPLVALYLPLLIHAGTAAKELAALAAGSTIAGNLLILGAASNVIIIQNAEKKGETITFMDFAKVGIPLTILNVIVYWYFLIII